MTKPSRLELVKEITSVGFWSRGDSSLIGHRQVGNNLWLVVNRSERCTVILYRLSGNEFTGWSYKAVPEECMPVEIDCPLVLLAQAGDTSSEEAAAWRAEVVAHHQSKRAGYTSLVSHSESFISPRIGESIGADEHA